MSFDRKSIGEQTYVYVERTTPMSEIANAMGDGFGAVFGTLGAKGITPRSMPMSVYFEMADPLTFRVGAIVSAEDAAASGLDQDTLPGEVVTTLHTGAYSGLGATHQALWKHMEAEGMAAAMPVWEIYIDDPGDTAEADLRTEIYRAVGG